MFTGLVQAVGVVGSCSPSPAGVRLRVGAGSWSHRPEPGESISVSGACLTLAAPATAGNDLDFDVVPETLSKTTLGRLVPGSSVNLERACRPSDLMGGHIVQGHVDGVGRVAGVRADPWDWRVAVEPPAGLMEFLAPKGSVCIEGVSLTVASLDPGRGRFEVALIPTTLERTTLRGLREGDAVNLEMDCIAKTIVHWLRVYAPRGG